MHDVYDDGSGPMRVVNDLLRPSGRFMELLYIHGLFIARKIAGG
jgi:hypothetical protein